MARGFGVFAVTMVRSLGGAMDAAPDLFVGQQPEPALDLVEPGGAGGCEMGLPARPFGEPVADRLGLVGPVVVHDDVDVEISRDVRLDEVEEFAELSGPMARRSNLAMTLAWRCRGPLEETPPAIGACSRWLRERPRALDPGRIGEAFGWQPHPRALDLERSFRRDREPGHRRSAIWRRRIDVLVLLSTKKGSPDPALDRSQPMRLQAEGPPDAMNGRAARGRSPAPSSEGSNGSRPAASLPASAGPLPRHGVIADLTRRAGAGFVVQTVEALRRIAAIRHLPNGVRARHFETNGDLLVLQRAFRRRQDDPRRRQPPRTSCERTTTTSPTNQRARQSLQMRSSPPLSPSIGASEQTNR